MDTKFSTAIHSLILINESKDLLSSEEIAKRVGVNSSYIRKVLGMLRKSGIIDSQRGICGFNIVTNPKELSLYEIYRAVNKELHIFDIHQNANDECIVGKHIKPTLESLFSGFEDKLKDELSNKTLNDCIEQMRTELTEKELEFYESL